MEWKPIESAPKNETVFLGYFDNGEQHVVYLNSKGECGRDFDIGKWTTPTYWMPLPQPPKEE